MRSIFDLDETSNVLAEFAGGRNVEFAGATRTDVKHSNVASSGYTRGMFDPCLIYFPVPCRAGEPVRVPAAAAARWRARARRLLLLSRSCVSLLLPLLAPAFSFR